MLRFRNAVIQKVSKRIYSTQIQATKNVWDDIQSKNGEVKLDAQNFTRELLKSSHDQYFDQGILVQLSTFKPNLRLVHKPIGNKWQFKDKAGNKRTIRSRDISWQFPPNETEDNGLYDFEEKEMIQNLTKSFLEQQITIELQEKLKKLWQNLLHNNKESNEVLKTFKSMTMSVLSREEIWNEVKGSIEIPEKHKSIINFILNQIIISTPFFSLIPNSTYYLIHTKEQVKTTMKHLIILKLLKKLQLGEYKSLKEALDSLNSKLEEIQTQEIELLSFLEYYYDFSYQNDWIPSFNFTDQSSIESLNPEFLAIIKNMIFEIPGKLTNKIQTIQEVKNKTKSLTPPEFFSEIFFDKLEEFNYSPNDKNNKLLLNHICGIIKPIFMEILISGAFNFDGLHLLVQDEVSTIFNYLKISKSEFFLRSLLISLDQLPYYYCFEYERSRRLWFDSDKILSLRESPTVVKEYLSNSLTSVEKLLITSQKDIQINNTLNKQQKKGKSNLTNYLIEKIAKEHQNNTTKETIHEEDELKEKEIKKSSFFSSLFSPSTSTEEVDEKKQQDVSLLIDSIFNKYISVNNKNDSKNNEENEMKEYTNQFQSNFLEFLENNKIIPKFNTAVAIDGPETFILDDCVSCTENGDSPWVHIHIADTSTNIKPNSFIDIQARYFGVNQYFSDEILRILPPYVDAKLSLRKGKNHVLTFSAQINDGRITDYRIHFSIINNMLTNSYDQVHEFTKKERANRFPMLKMMVDIATSRRNSRIHLLDDCYRQSDVGPLRSEILVEEFMLIAGHVAALFCDDNNIPCFYRTQESINDELVHKALQLGGVSRNIAILQMTKSAKYSTTPLPHFLVNVDKYAHVTSPLRRYSDMLIHHQIGAFLRGLPLPFSHKNLEDIVYVYNYRSRIISTAQRRQANQSMFYFYADSGKNEFKGVLKNISTDPWNLTVLEFVPLISDDFMHTIKITLDHWPGDQFYVGATYLLELVIYPHISWMSGVIKSVTNVDGSEIPFEFSFPPQEMVE